MNSFITLLPWIILVFGPVLASFFTAKVMRDNELTKVRDLRSACDNCGHTLSPIELIPIFSFIFLRGRCRNCNAPINWKIFGAEVLGLILYGILAVGVMQFSVLNSAFDTLVFALAGFIILSVLLYLSIFDGFTYTIPTVGVQVGIVLAIAINIIVLVIRFVDAGRLVGMTLGNIDNLIAGVGSGLFFQAIIILTKQRGMGVGDVFAAVIIGLSLGWVSVVTAFYVMIISAALMGVVVAWRRGKFRGTVLPLVPFMTFGFVVAYVWGVPIYNLLFRIV